MAPRLYGEHFQVKCEDCGIVVNVDTKIPKQKTFACPNCGFAHNKIPSMVSNADHVEVQLNSVAKLERWDLAAIKRHDEGYHVVKRVIGLPGENVQIEYGDIWINHKRVEKTLDDQHRIRIPVHDTDYRPAANLPARWRPDLDSSGWTIAQGDFVFTPSAGGSPQEFDWLTYHHWRGFHHQGSRTDDFPIEDSYAFNQAINRSLVAMQDLYLELRLAAPITGELAIRVWRGEHLTEFQFLAKHVLVVANNSDALPGEFPLPVALSDIRTVEVSTFDSRLQVALNGDNAFIDAIPLVESDAVSPTDALSPTKHSFQIGARNGETRISRLRVFRDIYYRNLRDAPVDGFQLGENEYFFLGDNVPISIDSRQWPTAVRRSEILGRIEIGPRVDSFVP